MTLYHMAQLNKLINVLTYWVMVKAKQLDFMNVMGKEEIRYFAVTSLSMNLTLLDEVVFIEERNDAQFLIKDEKILCKLIDKWEF